MTARQARLAAAATMLMATTLLALGTAAPAQDFEGDPDPYAIDGPEPYDSPDDGRAERRHARHPDGHAYDDDDFGGGLGGDVCVTARGNCVVPPTPELAPCGCMIPGFGFKRGAVAR